MANYHVSAVVLIGVACFTVVQPASGIDIARKVEQAPLPSRLHKGLRTKIRQGSRESILNEISLEALSSTKTNGGLFTLQGLPTGGLPLNCAVPQCDRSDGCAGKKCCSTQMFEALTEITGWMDSNSVEYVLLFGTLLGAYRDKDIIPWTGDIDLGIYSKDVDKLIAQKDIPWNFAFQDSFTIPRGCENHHPGFPGKYSNFTMSNSGFCNENDPNSCSYYVDFYVLDSPEHGGTFAQKCVKSSLGSDDHVKTTSVEVRGNKFAAPAHIEDCLVSKYGKDWAIPDNKHSFHG